MLLGDVAALVAAAALFAIAVLHLYWALGGRWPGHDDGSLVATVVGEPPDKALPSPAACLAVMLALLVATALPLAARGWIQLPGPHWLLSAGVFGLAGVLALRGLGGYLERRLRPVVIGLPYDRLNRWLYSPLCLVLATAVALAGVA